MDKFCAFSKKLTSNNFCSSLKANGEDFGVCSAYFGSILYITLVELPARFACSPEVARAQWLQSVRWTPRYAASALVAAAAALIRGKVALSSPWTWGSILLLSVVPFAVVRLLPIQRRLSILDRSVDPVETGTQLKQWGWRHAVRTCCAIAAFVLFLWAALKIS